MPFDCGGRNNEVFFYFRGGELGPGSVVACGDGFLESGESGQACVGMEKSNEFANGIGSHGGHSDMLDNRGTLGLVVEICGS